MRAALRGILVGFEFDMILVMM